MSTSRPSKRRNNAKKAQVKQAAKKAAERAEAAGLALFPIPNITEDDLLAFQTSHFGDEARPDIWFVDAEAALDFDPAAEDDGLGYYEDGVKRTLTEQQIEMFRHSEMEMLRREELRRREEEGVEGGGVAVAGTGQSSRRAAGRRSTSRTNRSDNASSTGPGKKKRKEEVPYGQRHKRKWEDYIEEDDPKHGSMTHRRIVRELDNHDEENVELDY